ncbi:PREDICTED: low-temperature-induced 65 kDa protein-like isoform X2 [Nelumbo nucifera]|uniref:Low-temperature-induced 65 kDa protein-like isoform X2 n=2 Tax=Nelumbo nucifera TaxID=4432 RepID=A0A1U8AY66_NELNU|nr:PREDICTED: low-temperature-induced 65 kDa protein-like isoform X2 [Nelumbo nucifera]DAD47423.1 TPA_asm: hypothetical protein HUJ06_017360 [Nelumbo nucifera]
MDTDRVATAQSHTYEEGPHDPHTAGLRSVIEGEDEHHEKKSVLKKVKAKAKKIKDTLGIKKHGNGHDYDHDHDDDDDDDDEVEEDEQDTEVHKEPPIYESIADRIEEEDASGQSIRVNLGPIGRLPPLLKDPDAPKGRGDTSDPANYQTKATDPTGAGGEEVRVEPILESFGKMKVSEQPEPEAWSNTGSHDQFSPDLPPDQTNTSPGNAQTVPVTEAVVHSQAGEAGNPTTQPSSYTEKISSATSAIAEKAVSAKNAVASKLGYGGNDAAVPGTPEGGDSTKSAPAGEYGRKFAEGVTGTLAPVYEKVSGAGSAVVSKMQMNSNGRGNGTATAAASGTGSEGGNVIVPDKGVSVKEYLAEKLRPGDEDKALSEVISEALNNRKEEPEKGSPPQREVTESTGTQIRLSSEEKNSTERVSSADEKYRKGMVSKIKGAVYSWFGKEGQHGALQGSHSAPAGANGRKLQE